VRHEYIARYGGAGDINSDKAWMVQIQSAPDRYYGLNSVRRFYYVEVTPADRPEIKKSTVSAFVAWYAQRSLMNGTMC